MQQTDLGLNLSTKRTSKLELLALMNALVSWADLVSLIAAYAPEGKHGRPPFELEEMLRIHFMHQWFTLSDPAVRSDSIQQAASIPGVVQRCLVSNSGGTLIMIRSKSFGGWSEVFRDRVVDIAILNRLLHHAVTGDNGRLKDSGLDSGGMRYLRHAVGYFSKAS